MRINDILLNNTVWDAVNVTHSRSRFLAQGHDIFRS